MIVRAAADDAESVPAPRRRPAPWRSRPPAAGIRANPGSAASFRQTALAAMMCISGPPWMPGNVERSRSLAYFSRQRINPPRGPRSVLCVVVETKSAYGTGLGCTPAAIRPAMCAMSTNSSAPDGLRDLRHARKIEDARIGARAGHDHFRLVLAAPGGRARRNRSFRFLSRRRRERSGRYCPKNSADGRGSGGRRARDSFPEPCRRASARSCTRRCSPACRSAAARWRARRRKALSRGRSRAARR